MKTIGPDEIQATVQQLFPRRATPGPGALGAACDGCCATLRLRFLRWLLRVTWDSAVGDDRWPLVRQWARIARPDIAAQAAGRLAGFDALCVQDQAPELVDQVMWAVPPHLDQAGVDEARVRELEAFLDDLLAGASVPARSA